MKKALMMILLCLAMISFAFPRDIFEIAKDGTHEEMKAAIEAGVDIEARDDFGRTPLHLAAALNTTPEVLLVLLKLGADPKARSKGGYTPWDYIQLNEAMKNTKAYWALNDARYE